MMSKARSRFAWVVASVATATMALEARAGSLPAGFEPRAKAALVVDGKAYEIPLARKGAELSARNYDISGPGGAWSAKVTVSMNADPEIVYQASVIDFGAASTFNFIFTQAIAPTLAPGIVRHVYAGHTTDSSTDGTTVTPAAVPAGIPVDGDGIPEVAVYSLSNDGGALWTNVGHDVGPVLAGASPADTHGPFSETGAGPIGVGTYNSMRVDVAFTLPGAEDSYSFSGRASVQ